jgi:hypothetical protein
MYGGKSCFPSAGRTPPSVDLVCCAAANIADSAVWAVSHRSALPAVRVSRRPRSAPLPGDGSPGAVGVYCAGSREAGAEIRPQAICTRTAPLCWSRASGSAIRIAGLSLFI